MNKTIIPERWKLVLDRGQLNGPYDARLERKMLEELGAAEQERDQLRTMLQRLEYQMSQLLGQYSRLSKLLGRVK